MEKPEKKVKSKYVNGLMGATQSSDYTITVDRGVNEKDILTLDKLRLIYNQIKETDIYVNNGNVSVSHDIAQNYDAISLAIKHILIEPLFFNDYYVAVYDENNNLLLEKKYFTKSLLSAKITAYELSKEEQLKDFPIYICNKNVDGTINYEKIVLKYKNEHDSETTS